MKTKIMIFIYSLSGGGAERTIVNLINNLNKKKFEVVLVLGTTNNSDYIDLIDDKIKLIILNSKKLRYSLLKLRNCIIKEKPDILFSTINANNIIMLLARLLIFKNIPTIVRESNNRTQSGSVTLLNKLITNLLYNYVASKVIALSKGVKEDLVNNFFIKENKIQVIYNPVEVEKIKQLSKQKLNGFNKNNNEKLIISVGRLVEQKDYPTLIKAFSILEKKVSSRLIILGKGPLEKKLKKICKDYGLEEKVQFVGFKNNPYKFMRAADLFVLSSKWEGFGHVIVESMAVGTPVISTDCKSGPSEIIGKNEYGKLVSVGNAEELSKNIISLLENPTLLDFYSKQGIKRANDFDAKTITEQYEKVFYSIIKDKNK